MNAATSGLDGMYSLKDMQFVCHAGTPDPEHDGQEVVGQRQMIAPTGDIRTNYHDNGYLVMQRRRMVRF